MIPRPMEGQPVEEFGRGRGLAAWLSGVALAAALASAPPAFAAHPSRAQAPSPPQPQPTAPSFPLSTGADWSCTGGKCTYVKLSGPWSNCFIAYSPVHHGYMPTRYCR